MQSPTRPRPTHLRLVTQPATTPCPPWCSLRHDHTDTGGERTCHYSQNTYAGPVTLRLDIDDDGHPALELITEKGDGDKLGLDDVDDLIAKLPALRAELAATIAERSAAA